MATNVNGNEHDPTPRLVTTGDLTRGPLAAVIDSVVRRAVRKSNLSMTPQQMEAESKRIAAGLEERKRIMAAAEAKAASPVTAFVNAVGTRYADCTLDNFRYYKPGETQQRAIVAECRKIVANLPAYIGDPKNPDPDKRSFGTPIVFMGEVGTGKDHLMAALLREVFRRRVSFRRINGAELASHCRDIIGSTMKESEFLAQWSDVALLALSDPDGSRESAYYLDWLLRIIDARYRDGRSFWMTINARDESDCEKLIGVRAWDRIRHGATILHCNWPSFRRERLQINTPGQAG